MAKPQKRLEAERMYTRQNMTCVAIAAELKVDKGTVYRWRTEAAEKGKSTDWDTQRRVYNMSPRELLALYAETVKAWVVQISRDPSKLSDPKIADAISKHVSVMQKIDVRGQYLGVGMDLIDVANKYLAENDPALQEKMKAHWEGIHQAFVGYSTKKGVY